MRTKSSGALAFLAFCLLLIGCPVAASAQSVAMATDVAGTVTSGGKSVSILSEIAADARVDLAAGARLVAVYLQAGDEYAFTGPAQVQFRSPEPQVLSGAKPQRRASPLGRGVAVKPVNVAQGAFVMRSGRNTARIKLFTLAGTKSLSATPEFRWEEVEPDTQYRFELTDETGKSLLETTLKGSSLSLPPSVQLRDGGSYMWELAARLADGRRYVSTGDFSVATADVRARAESMRPASGAPVSQRVAYAAWLEDMELRDEARKYWRALAAERPDDAKLKALAAE
ncbi:MAG: hypothetical protein HY322_13965 [Betaproteobacteria bacterium]|nr:hypothetical protein [Betaproteobacteria bacterium]